MDETAVISAVLGGDRDAYAALVERYQTGLVIHCDQMLGDRAEAEDAAQQAFIKAYQQLARFDPDRSRFSTWLYRIATNLAIDQLRARRPTVSLEDIQLPAPPDLSLFEAETIATTRNAVASLRSADQRYVVNAYYWKGHSYAQIAQERGVPINTVKSWLRRAKTHLKENLS